MNIRSAAALALLAAFSPALAQKRDLSKGNTLYVVPYAHLDTQWRWAYPQVIREFIPNTLHKNFDLIDKYPNYVFNFSGSRRYEFMKEYYPADYEKLKAYVKAGRWFPAGSSVDEGDANVPSAESLIRHVLYGNRFFKREFGVASQEFMLPDCFGFPYALPSILAHCGVQGFSTQKLTWGSAVGIPFKVGQWIGPDGKGVVAALDPGSYSADITEDLSQNTSWLARIQNTGKQSGAFVDYHYYGTGDIGGGPHDSAVDWVEKSIKGKGPITVVSSHSDEMFKTLTPKQIAKLPKYQGELLLTQHSAGSISSQAYMKRWNRKNELLADGAERASVGAMLLGGAPYPSERLYNAWDLVLGSQMHDMLPGTSIPKAYEFCWNDELLALNQFAAVETDAVGAIASQMDTKGEVPILVYNPLSQARQDVVEATIPHMEAEMFAVWGPDGKPVPTQTLGATDGNVRVLFLAKTPATGFAVFDAQLAHVANYDTGLSITDRQLENDQFKVTLNDDGDIASIFDKRANKEVLKAPARLAFQYHNPSAFPAWNMDWDDAKLPPDGYVHGPARIRIVEQGPVRVALEVERETNGSKFVQQIRLSAGEAGDRVEVLNKIDWKTPEHALKATFPLTTGNPKATYDLQLGAIQRGNNEEKKYEVPQHQWLDLSQPDGKYGVGILNESKYGSDKPDDDTVRLTLIYTPGVKGGYWDQATQDFGHHEILYAIQPHEGDWRNVSWSAKRLNQPLRAFAVPKHGGPLGKSVSLFSTSSRQVEISAIKKAEDSDEVIVRLRELEGRPAKNVRIAALGGIASAREVNGQEEPIRPATTVNGSLVTSVPAFSLRTFAIKLGKAAKRLEPPTRVALGLAFDTDVASAATNPTDGAFNAAGESYPADKLPENLTVGPVWFKLGSTRDGSKNALAARGQTLKLPIDFSRVYVLAAADEDRPVEFKVGDRTVQATVQAWDGYVAQWDNRLWNPDLGEDFDNYTEWRGLVPGYVKDGEVAWFSNHKHAPRSGNEFYQYSYLYKLGFDIPAGASTITLPNDPKVKIFAITATQDGHDTAIPAAPLYDQLSGGGGVGQPSISPGEGEYHDATEVRIDPPLYWKKGGLRYTTDGSEPTASSAVYAGPFMLYRPATVKSAEVDESGKMGPISSASIRVNDTTSPAVLAATSAKALGVMRLRFSEAVEKASAESASNYRLNSGAKVVEAKLSEDGRAVEISLDKPLAPGQKETLTVTGVRDLSPDGNPVKGQTVVIEERGAVFISPPLEPKKSQEFKVESLPVKSKDAWTLNFFCKVDTMPEDLTIIAGFGRNIDGRTGTGRYFTKFTQGLNFWVSNRDVPTKVPLDLGKWQMLTATYDGTTMRLYKNGEQIAEQQVELENDRSQVEIMPLDAWDRKRLFGGEVRDLTIWNDSLPASAVRRLWEMGQKG